MKIQLIQAFIVVLLICKYEEDPLKIENGDFSKRLRAANSTVQRLIWPNFESIHDFIVGLVTCKNEEDPIKNEGVRLVTTLSIIFQDAKEQLTP